MLRYVLSCVLVTFLVGCGTGGNRAGDEQQSESRRKIKADAYLFDARIYRDGKPTSVRLECYVTDSVVGLSGRGYLGKGALKGRLTRDSIVVYFPSTNEFVSEKTADLLTSAADCVQINAAVDLLSIFSTEPDSIAWGAQFKILRSGNDDRPHYQISLKDCGWLFDLEYREDKNKMYLSKFEFNDGNGNRLKAKRRTLKKNASVPMKRFIANMPAGAIKIIP